MDLASIPAWPGVTHRMVDTGEVRLHVAEAGDGPPLLMAAGWPQHWWAMRHLIGPLARDHRVLVADLRGLGWSDAPRGAYAKETLAEDLLGLLDAEGIDRVKVVGHDWGGYAGWLLTLGHPERVDRFVALDIAPPWPAPIRPRQAMLPFFMSYMAITGMPVSGPAIQRSSAFLDQIFRLGSGRDMQWDPADLEIYAARLREPGHAQATSSYYRTFLTRELLPSQAGRFSPADLEVPTLALFGAQSWIHRMIGRYVTPTDLLSVEAIDAGHFVAEEAPDRVLGLIEPFLTGSG